MSNEESLSQRQDKLESEVDVGAASLVEGALAGDERDRENRKARGVILQQQSTLANQQEAQARTVEQLTAEFDAENGRSGRRSPMSSWLGRRLMRRCHSGSVLLIASSKRRTPRRMPLLQLKCGRGAMLIARWLNSCPPWMQSSMGRKPLAASIDEVSRVSAEANQSLSEQLSQVKATAESAGTAAAGAQSSANQAKRMQRLLRG